MRLQLFSDVHLEFRGYDLGFLKGLQQPDIDLLVVAGDLMPLTDRKRFEEASAVLGGMAKEVVYVPGNHEYYGTTPTAARILVEAADRADNVIFMEEPDGLNLDCGIETVAGTMWYDFHAVKKVTNPLTGQTVGDDGRLWRFSDFRWIHGLAPWCYDQNDAFAEALKRNMPEIVITHHLPHPGSVAPKYRNESDNCFFMADQTKAIKTLKPKLWLHGHTHEAFDYVVGDTRIICNPVGYPGEKRDTKYAPLVVEI